MIQYFAYFLLFALPFIVNPFGGGAFSEPPKVILAEVAIEVILAYFLLRYKFKLQKSLLLPIAMLFVLSLLNLLLHSSLTAFFGNQFRLQGTFLLWHLLIWALISSQFELKIPRRLSYLLLPALLFVIFLMGNQINGRAVGTLGEPNALAASAVFFWPFLYFNYPKKYGFLIKIICLVITLTIVFLSGSRSGLVAFAVQLVFLSLLSLGKNLKIAVVVSMILSLLALTLPFLGQNSGFKFENRAEVWRVSFQAGFNSPIFGQGFGNVEQALKPVTKSLNSDLQYQYVDSAHNLLLDYWIEGGLVGLGALTILIVLSLKNFSQQKMTREVVLFIGLLICLAFNPVSVVSLIAFWWLIGQGLKS